MYNFLVVGICFKLRIGILYVARQFAPLTAVKRINRLRSFVAEVNYELCSEERRRLPDLIDSFFRKRSYIFIDSAPITFPFKRCKPAAH